MGPEELKGLVMFMGIASQLVDEDLIPGLKKLFGDHYQLSEAERAELDNGFAELVAARAKLKARRAELAGG